MTNSIINIVPKVSDGYQTTLVNPMSNDGDIIFGGDNGSPTQLSGNTTTAKLFLSETGNGTTAGAPVWSTVPVPGIAASMFQNIASGISGLKDAYGLGLYTPGTLVTETYNSVNNNQQLAAFITTPGLPDLILIPYGNILVHMHAYTSQAFISSYLYATISTYSIGGVETVIATTENSLALTGSSTGMDMIATVQDVSLASTDRLITRVYISCGSNHPNITIQYDGTGTNTTNSRLQTPVAGVDASNFVPYTGAIQTLNLGTNALTVNAAITGKSIVLSETTTYSSAVDAYLDGTTSVIVYDTSSNDVHLHLPSVTGHLGLILFFVNIGTTGNNLILYAHSGDLLYRWNVDYSNATQGNGNSASIIAVPGGWTDLAFGF